METETGEKLESNESLWDYIHLLSLAYFTLWSTIVKTIFLLNVKTDFTSNVW